MRTKTYLTHLEKNKTMVIRDDKTEFIFNNFRWINVLEEFFDGRFQSTESGVTGSKCAFITKNVDLPKSTLDVLAIEGDDQSFLLSITWRAEGITFLSVAGFVTDLSLECLSDGIKTLIFNGHNNTYGLIRSSPGEYKFRYDIAEKGEGLKYYFGKQYG